jgi:hypothetical protein
MTLSAFPDRVPDAERAGLLKTFRQLPPPIPEAQFEKLFRDVGAARFATRQRAQRALENLGIEAEPALRRLLEGEPSPEIHARCGQVLKKWQPEYPRSNAPRFLTFLRGRNKQLENDLIRALAAGPPTSWTTLDARRGLSRLATSPQPE